ncbi:MAG: KH domain-containing protein [Candidatus Nanoarchaeia archaeon]|nr:KH domain-containing protein [Candidatus Nanoarchaeia archaeon]
MSEYFESVKLPKERVNVVIGKKGEIKRKIQKKTGTKIKIDEESSVSIISDNGLSIWHAKDIIKAIGRGFSPEKALLIDGENYVFEVIEINDYARNENDIKRLKGRIIGKEGKSRELIEKSTGAFISVYGKTVSIICPIETADTVRKAVQMLLEGAMHKTVYNMIEKKKMELKKDRIFNLN